MKKRLSLLLSSCLFGLFLSKTNPKIKDPYVRRVTQDVQSLCCRTLFTATTSRCDLLRPVTQPVVHGLVSLYTDPPKSYIFFTHYTTRLPSHTVQGVGVAGQFIRWNTHSHDEAACFL